MKTTVVGFPRIGADRELKELLKAIYTKKVLPKN